jgi:hypothetical protein
MEGEAMTYEQFIGQSIARQRSVIRREHARMRAAGDLFLKYAADMAKLDLHALTWLEIGDRRAQLDIMERNINETHGCSETMRALYEAKFGQKRRKQ